MLCLVLGHTSRDRESVPQVLYIGHDRALALELLEAGAPGIIRTEYFFNLPQAAKNRTFSADAEPVILDEPAPVVPPAAPAEKPAAPEAPAAPEPIAESPAEEIPEQLPEAQDPDIEEPWKEAPELIEPPTAPERKKK